MSHGPHVLLHHPSRSSWKSRPGEIAVDDPTAFAIQRHRGPMLGFSTSYAYVGSKLLPETERPVRGGAVGLVWAPMVPSQCLLTARDVTGVYRLVAPGADPALHEAMEQLEVECACAFEAALVERCEVLVERHLEAALSSCRLATLRVAELLARGRGDERQRPFWLEAGA